MVDSQFGTNAPNGSVGVYGWLRNADMRRYTPGIIDGFAGRISGMSYQPASSPYNTCLATNANGDRDVISLNTSDDNAKLPLSAPPTPNQARCYAIVVYKLATDEATQNNGLGTVHITAVPGTDSTQGSEIPPSDSAIRSAIAGGSTAYICVVAVVSVYYGDTSLDIGHINARLVDDTVDINGSHIPGYQTRSIPTANPIVLESSTSKDDNVWNTVKWSDGRLEMWGKFTVHGDFPFHQAGNWFMSTIPMPYPYPIQLAKSPGGKAHAVRSANLVGSTTGYVSPLYISNTPPVDRFGDIIILDFNNLVIHEPEVAVRVQGFWY